MTFLREAYPEMSIEDEREFFNENCDLIIRNVRFYLDHLDDGTLWVYKTYFFNYEPEKHKVYK